MIYFDNAATTFPKPIKVIRGVNYALSRLSANPGRSGHALSVAAADAVYGCRQRAAKFFGLDSPEGVIFTKNCTEALNTVIKGLRLENCEAVISSLEHNSVVRPLFALERNGVRVRKARVYFNDQRRTLESFKNLINDNTGLVICTHASNVCGTILPIREIGKLCRQKSVPFAVDAAQSGGTLPINMNNDNIDFLCVPGHKGLYGPMGTGLLLCNKKSLYPLTEGGTGNLSQSVLQPNELPERLESGTLNLPGIVGIERGIDFVENVGLKAISSREAALCRLLYGGLYEIKGIELYGENPFETDISPVISFNVKGVPSERVSSELSKASFAVRAGLHCSPLAHKSLGTEKNGTVRVSFSVFNTPSEVKNFMISIKNIQKNL